MSWKGIKQTINIEDTQAWCEKMDIKDYTINFKGEIDVEGDVYLRHNTFEELPYKFGRVTGFFTLMDNKNLTSLKNCPDYVIELFACDFCPKLDSLEGCPTEVGSKFFCDGCKRKFSKKEVTSLCKVNVGIIN